MNDLNVTLLIKTFNREKCLLRLLKSIRRFYPHIKIIIVDDSALMKESFFSQYHNIDYYYIGYDKGLSYGRNYGLDKIKTDYFILLDDDFYFTKKTDIALALNLITERKLDILSFKFLDFGLFERKFCGNYYIENGNLYCNNVKKVTDINESENYDFVLNCFIAKTESCRLVGWDDNIKLGYEHDDFFLRAKSQKLLISTTRIISVLHFPFSEKKYKEKRSHNLEKYKEIFYKNHNIKTHKKINFGLSFYKRVIFKLMSNL